MIQEDCSRRKMRKTAQDIEVPFMSLPIFVNLVEYSRNAEEHSNKSSKSRPDRDLLCGFRVHKQAQQVQPPVVPEDVDCLLTNVDG